MPATKRKAKLAHLGTGLRPLRDVYRDMYPDMPTSPALDLIGVWPDGRLHFPTLCTCAVCEGVTSCAPGPDRTPTTPWIEGAIVLEIALLEHGYNMARWEGRNVTNTYSVPHACTCECKHEWDSACIGRCLHRWTCRKCGHTRVVDSSD